MLQLRLEAYLLDSFRGVALAIAANNQFMEVSLCQKQKK